MIFIDLLITTEREALNKDTCSVELNEAPSLQTTFVTPGQIFLPLIMVLTVLFFDVTTIYAIVSLLSVTVVITLKSLLPKAPSISK